jgi:hypothetical protein
MSRGTKSRRPEARAPVPAEESPPDLRLVEQADRRAERVDAENLKLAEQLREAEAWYHLLQVDHAALGRKHERIGRKAAELQAELDRLGSMDRDQKAAGPPEGSGRLAGPGPGEDSNPMIRISNWTRLARRHWWATAGVIVVATLLARDPGVRDLGSQAVARVRQTGHGGEPTGDPAASGYVRYAAMIWARDEAERARAEYNDREATLKGDALLEAQDRLRAVKARHRQARVAFLPELARRCEQARIPVPREAVEALASLRQEIGN